MTNKILYISIYIFLISFFSACGDDGTKWGIDNRSGILLPICNGDKTTATNAMLLKANYTVEPLLENTNILLWHFDNGDKLACVSTGKAIMKDL